MTQSLNPSRGNPVEFIKSDIVCAGLSLPVMRPAAAAFLHPSSCAPSPACVTVATCSASGAGSPHRWKPWWRSVTPMDGCLDLWEPCLRLLWMRLWSSNQFENSESWQRQWVRVAVVPKCDRFELRLRSQAQPAQTIPCWHDGLIL